MERVAVRFSTVPECDKESRQQMSRSRIRKNAGCRVVLPRILANAATSHMTRLVGDNENVPPRDSQVEVDLHPPGPVSTMIAMACGVANSRGKVPGSADETDF